MYEIQIKGTSKIPQLSFCILTVNIQILIIGIETWEIVIMIHLEITFKVFSSKRLFLADESL